MESALVSFSNTPLTNRFWRYAALSRAGLVDYALRKPLSSKKGLEFDSRYEVLFTRRLLEDKVLTGWATRGPRTLQVLAKFRKGGKSENGDNMARYGHPFSSGSSGFRSPVPLEQQPVNEYQNLVESVLFSWAVGDLWLYTLKLSAIGAAVTLLLGWPVMASNLDPEKELLKCGTGALCGGLFAVTLAALRMYLGWAYVGNRLFSATVEYEETGWYDGEIWIKPPEVLARDRLLGSYKVKPALSRVKFTLIGLAASLAVCTLFFLTIQETHGDVPVVAENISGSSRPSSGTAYSEASARLYEPEAFASDEESMLPDYCH
eukprot:c11171_g1_i1 orf=105-1061(+)